MGKMKLKYRSAPTTERCNPARYLALLIWIVFVPLAIADEERIDTSDPTKIYTFMGGGFKYNDYTNGDYMWEVGPVRNWKTTGTLSLMSPRISNGPYS